MRHVTHCDFHLGDNLFHLHFLRALSQACPEDTFEHHAHACHIPQLNEMLKAQITLLPLESFPVKEGSIDAWKNAGGFFERHPDRNDYYGFYLDWFAELARRMGLAPVFSSRADLLFDYPALEVESKLISQLWLAAEAPLDGGICDVLFDVLFVNSQPCSGQWMPMAYAPNDDGNFLNEPIAALVEAGNRVITTQRLTDGFPVCAQPRPLCTRDYGLSVTGIGNLSLHCKSIVMIGTGPAWPTMNVFNRTSLERRILLFHPERVDGFGDFPHARDRDELMAILKEEGLI